MRIANSAVLNVYVDSVQLLSVLPFKKMTERLDGGSGKTSISFTVVDGIDTFGMKSIMGSCFYGLNEFVVTIQGRRISTVFNDKSNSVECRVERGDSYEFASEYLNGLVRVISLANDNLFLHSSTVIDSESNSNTFVSWANTGKTRFMLALRSLGLASLSDEWTLFNKEEVYPVESDLCLMWYDIKMFPNVFHLNALTKISLALYEKMHNRYLKFFFTKIGVIRSSVTIPSIIAFPDRNKPIRHKRIFLLENSANDFSFEKIQTLDELFKYTRIFKRENNEFVYYLNIYQYCFPNHWLNEAWIDTKIKSIIESSIDSDAVYKVCLPSGYSAVELLKFCEKLIDEL